MNNKRVALSLFIVVLMVSLIVGCTNKGTPDNSANGNPSSSATSDNNSDSTNMDVYPENGLSKDEKVTLKIAIDENGYGRGWMDHAIDNFTAKYPNVSFDITASPAIYEMIQTKQAANNDADMFDIFPGKIGADSIKMIEEGFFEPVEDLFDREVPDTPGKTVKDILIDGIFENQPRHAGIAYNLPVGGYTAGWFFDKKLFEEKAWNQNPQTWTEFLQLLEQIKADGITPIVYAGVYAHDYMYTFGFGPKIFEIAEMNGTLDTVFSNYKQLTYPKYTTSEYIESWNRLYELGQKGYIANGVAAINHTQSQMMILQGKAALVPTGDWVGNEMKDATPEGFKWGFMTPPLSENANDTKWIMSDMTSGGYLIWGKKPELNRKWAKEFLLSLVNMDQQAYMVEHAGIYPVRNDFLDDLSRLDIVQDAPRAVMEYMSKNNVRTESLKTEVVIDHPAIVNALKVVTEAANEMITGKKEPRSVLEEADRVFKEAIDSVK